MQQAAQNLDPRYTSQKCSACLKCGFEINADLDAAINILVAGSCPEYG